MDSDEESPSKRVKTGGNEEESGNTETPTTNSNYPRRLVSVFSSNQAIHKLTDKIIRSQLQQEQQEKEQQEKEQQEKEQQPRQTNLRKDSDEVEMTESNAINPNIDYPHQRHFCGLYKFEMNNSLLFCQKCYCYVCNIPAQDCKTWSIHCHAHDSLEWREQRRVHAATNASIAVSNATTAATAVVNNADGNHVILLDDSSDDDTHANTHANTHNNTHNNADPKPQDSDNKTNILDDNDSYQDEQDEQHSLRQDEDLLRRVQAMHNHNYNHHFDPAGPAGTDKDMIGQKARKDARIPEVLAHNLRQISNLAISNSSTSNRSSTSGAARTGTGENNHKMEGDVPQLNLHNSFFVEGVRIGWPYPAIMPPQRLMAIHLTKAFKNKRHVVIESPTGTG